MKAENGGTEILAPGKSTPQQVLKGCMKNISTLTELCRAINIDYDDRVEMMLYLIRQATVDDQPLPANSATLRLLPIEQFTHLEIPVVDFREVDVFQIHWACCTRMNVFRNGSPRNDWVWI